MGASERWERYQKAIKEGEQAYRAGITKDDCPYKTSTWGLGAWWKMGWRDAKNQAIEAGGE